jgi:hypothetical protein
MEHLEMMERVLGSIPGYLLGAANPHKIKSRTHKARSLEIRLMKNLKVLALASL